jgi:hypothetical protein
VQSERRDAFFDRAWRDLPTVFADRADQLAEGALAGKLVLFLGAGVGASGGLPLWRRLLDEIARVEGLDDLERAQLEELPPHDRANLIQKRMGPDRPIAKAAAALLDARSTHYGLMHAELAALPVDAAVTTNYDQLFERASFAASRPISVVPYERVKENQRWLLKLHGSTDHPEDIVLTRDDFLAYREGREALAGIVQALLITKHMLFVGFSLEDDNFHQIVHAVRRAMGNHHAGDARLGTSLMVEGNPFAEELWSENIAWIHFGSTHKDDAKIAARTLDIFLDRLAARACDSSAHLFDRRYAEVLSKGEREIRDLLLGMVTSASGDAKQTHAWAEIERTIRRLGWKRSR